MQPRLTRVSTILLIAAAACFSDRPGLLEPNHVISDGAHSGGTPGFFFLPPMVAQPAATGLFDPDIVALNPVVLICDVTAGPDVDCGGATPALRVFTRTTSPAITMDGEKYGVNWDTREGDFAPGRTYRIHVLGGTPSRELGFADIFLTTEPGKVKKLADGETVVLNDGRTLPIHFRIEQGVIVLPGPAVSLDITGLSDPTVAGTAGGVTVTARDEHGNVATSYAGTIAFTSTDPEAALPGEYTFTAGDVGVRSFPAGVTLKTAGVQSVQAIDAAVSGIAGNASVTVDAAAAAELRFTIQPSAAPAGASIAPPIVITAYDQFGNVAPSFAEQVTVAIGANPGAGVLAGTLQASAALGVATFDELRINVAGSGYTLVASATGLTSATSDPFDISATDARVLEVSGLSDPTVAGAVSSITVTARDEHGNIATGYAGTIAFTSTDPEAMLPGEYTFTAGDAGSHTFPASVTLRTAGSVTVTATDAGIASIDGSQTVTVAPAAAVELVLSGLPDGATAGAANDLTVTARDQFANIASGYTGTVQFSSGDPAAMVPDAYQFQASDAGVRTFIGEVTFRTAGLQSFEATDAAIPATTSVAISVEAAAAAQLRFTTQPTDAPEGATIAPPVVVTAFDAFDNVATGFAGQVSIALGANPGGAVLAGTLQVSAALGVATFGNLSISADGAGYTLVAAATGLAGATSDPFTVTSVAPTEVHWISALSGSWSDGTKWSTGAAPTPDQAVFIDANGTYTVTLNVNATVNALTLGATTGVQTLSAGSGRVLSISTAGTIASTGRLTLTSATLTGPGQVINAGVTRLIGSAVANPFTNQGTLIGEGVSSLSGVLTTQVGSTLRVVGTAAFNPSNNFTVTAGFTNHGTIELTNTLVNAAATLTVSSGTVVNALGATISVAPGVGGGIRTFNAQLDNQGTLTVAHPLTISRGSADHTSSGTITLSGGNLAITQSQTTPTFTNTGRITVPASRTLSVSGGTFTQSAAATLDGGGAMSLTTVTAAFGTAFDLSALSLSNTTASFATNLSTETLALGLNNAVLNGPVTLTNAAGKTLTVDATDINTALVNAGTIVVLRPSTVTGTFTTQLGSLLRVLGTSNLSSGWGALTVANGFTNRGLIELTVSHAGAPASLTVTSGTLVNAPGATITLPTGAGAGIRRLDAELDNQGTLDVGAPLTMSVGSAQHQNSGVIGLTGGNLTINQSAAAPSVTNTGAITVPAGRTLILSGGTFTQSAGATLDGGGGFALTSVTSAAFGTAFTLAAMNLFNSTASFATDITTETLALILNGSAINGPGTLTNAAGKTLTLDASDINAPFINAGTVVSLRSSSVNGAFTTQTGSLLRVQGTSSQSSGWASLTMANGFTNAGLIELTVTAPGAPATLTVSSGTLVNALTGTISVLAGAGGGNRILTAQLDNQGTFDVGTALLINRGSADHTNSGTVRLNAGSLTLTQSGTTPSFTNSGLIDLVGPGAFVIGVGPFTNQASGSIQGAGTFEAGISTPLSNAGSITPTLARIGNALTGTGTFAPVTAEFFSNGTSIPAGDNYSYTNVRVLSSATFSGSKEITGNLTVAGSGNLTIGGHEIVVEGDFATQGSGVLTMQNALGVLDVLGNATFGGGSTNTRLTAGHLRVARNFTQAGGSAAAFAASPGHFTRIDGSTVDQTITFNNPGSTATTSHFGLLLIETAGTVVILNSPVFATGHLNSSLTERVMRGNGFTLQAAGASVFGLVLDSLPLRVAGAEQISQFSNVTFRNMDPTVTQLRFDRADDIRTFNNIIFETVPTTGLYLHLVDTNGGAPFTVTMGGTTPANHGGRVLVQGGAQLLGWPL